MSQSSRRQLQMSLAKLKSSVELFTMCLSCPGSADHLTHPAVKMSFLRMLKRLTAKSSRDSRFREVAGFWKQELQKRNLLHFHLVFSGITDANRDLVHQWLSSQWIECILSVPGLSPELVLAEKRKMLAVHLHSSNMEKIRGNFHSYFAKYLGKDVEAHAAEFPIPGRWWGRFNAPHLPLGEMREIELPPRVAVHMHRVARKIRQARADDAKHRALCRRLEMMNGKHPTVSRFQLLETLRRFKANGGVEGLEIGGFRRVVRGHHTEPLVMILKAITAGISLRDLASGFRFPAAMKYAGITLTGSHVPDMMLRVAHYAGGRALVDRDQTPF